MKRTVVVRTRTTRPAVGGSHDGMLVVRVREPATDGRANRAVVAAIAGSLGVGGGAVRIVTGAGSRRKTVEVDGDAAALSALWDALLGSG